MLRLPVLGNLFSIRNFLHFGLHKIPFCYNRCNNRKNPQVVTITHCLGTWWHEYMVNGVISWCNCNQVDYFITQPDEGNLNEEENLACISSFTQLQLQFNYTAL